MLEREQRKRSDIVGEPIVEVWGSGLMWDDVADVAERGEVEDVAQTKTD